MDFAPLEFNSRRAPVIGRGGIVSTSQPLATAAGLAVLAKGGNAADAAVAAGAALNVTEPTSTGIGGDMFALYFKAETGQVSALNGSGRAPATLTLERLAREGLLANALPPFHAYTVTVPGACAGWLDLLEWHGSLSPAEVLEPAIALAEDGFPVAPLTSLFWRRGVERRLGSAPNGKELTVDGRAPRAGELFRNPGLARTLRTVAEGGKGAFYEGPIARAIAEVVQQAGGCLTEADLAAHVSTWEEPISVPYGGYRVYECPPNGQGLATLIALNILGGFDLARSKLLSPESLHLQIEAMRLAFADARWYVADPDFSDIPIVQLLSADYAAERRKLIDPRVAIVDLQRGTPVASSDTVYLSVVDRFGNACSFINSNYMGFGTGIVPKGWGFSLQNRGHNFSLDPSHPNALAPGKRPYHTIIPAMATHRRSTDATEVGEGESLFACFGVMGGFMQPQGHLQVFSALADHNLDPQSALDLPRFSIGVEDDGGLVSIEEGIPVETMTRLAELGHALRSVSGVGRSLFGRGQVILRDAATGVLTAGSDPRADGCAMTLI